MKTEDIKNIVYNYPTDQPSGFTEKDLRAMLKEQFPNIDPDTLDLGTNTVTILSDGRIVRYHCDIERSIRLHLNKMYN